MISKLNVFLRIRQQTRRQIIVEKIDFDWIFLRERVVVWNTKIEAYFRVDRKHDEYRIFKISVEIEFLIVKHFDKFIKIVEIFTNNYRVKISEFCKRWFNAVLTSNSIKWHFWFSQISMSSRKWRAFFKKKIKTTLINKNEKINEKQTLKKKTTK